VAVWKQPKPKRLAKEISRNPHCLAMRTGLKIAANAGLAKSCYEQPGTGAQIFEIFLRIYLVLKLLFEDGNRSS